MLYNIRHFIVPFHILYLWNIKSIRSYHRRYLMEKLLCGLTNVQPSNTDYFLENQFQI